MEGLSKVYTQGANFGVGPLSVQREKTMDEQLKELARMIDEADKLADKISQASQGMQVIDRNVERMKACIKMMRIGVLEPVELG